MMSGLEVGVLRIDSGTQLYSGLASHLQEEHIASRYNHQLFLWNAWVFEGWKNALG